jgi:hypothetical protein
MSKTPMRRVVLQRLPGTKKALIHWFEIGDYADERKLIAKNTTPGRIACMPNLGSAAPRTSGGLTKLYRHSDDVRAVNCPACLATPNAVAALAEYEALAARGKRSKQVLPRSSAQPDPAAKEG